MPFLSIHIRENEKHSLVVFVYTCWSKMHREIPRFCDHTNKLTLTPYQHTYTIMHTLTLINCQWKLHTHTRAASHRGTVGRSPRRKRPAFVGENTLLGQYTQCDHV